MLAVGTGDSGATLFVRDGNVWTRAADLNLQWDVTNRDFETDVRMHSVLAFALTYEHRALFASTTPKLSLPLRLILKCFCTTFRP